MADDGAPVIRRDKFFEDRLGEFIYKQIKASRFHEFSLYVGNLLRKRMPESMWLEESTKLPAFWLFSSAILFHVVFVVLVIWLGYDSYVSSTMDTFVSLSPDSGECLEVSRSVSGQYTATIKGQWSSQVGYSYNYTSYVVTLDNFNQDTSGFRMQLASVFRDLAPLAAKGYFRNFPWNLVLWSVYTYRYLSKEEGQFSFFLTGDAVTIFNNDFFGAAIGNSNGVCKSGKAVADFVTSDSSLVLTLPDYNLNASCKDVFSAENFGYNAVRSGTNDFSLPLDVRSFFVALGINFGMLQLEDLQIVAFSQGVDYAQKHCNKDEASCGGLFIDTYSTFYEPVYYAGMSTILCIGWDDGGESCLLQIGNVLAIPLITHFADCDCEKIRFNASLLEECNSVDILAGLLFYPEESVYEAPKTFDYMANMYLARKNDPWQDYVFHQNAYDAMYDIITSTYVGSEDVEKATPEHISASFQKVCNDGCSLAVFESWDQSSFDINVYYMQVQQGACNNSIIEGDGFSALGEFPPAQFTEKYYECTMTTLQAIVYSVGVTLQNADAFTNGAFIVIFAVLAWYLSNYRNYKNDLIHFKDKDELDREWKMRCLEIIDALPRNKNANLKLNAKVDRMIAELTATTLKNASEQEIAERQRMRGRTSTTAGNNAVIATEAAVELQTFTSPIASAPYAVRNSESKNVRHSLHGQEEDSDDEDGQ